MSHLTRHLTPGPFTLSLGHLLAGFREVMNHEIIGSYQAGNFIFLVIYDIFQSAGSRINHLPAHLHYRPEHLVHHFCRKKPGDYQQDEEHCYHEDRVEHCILLE